MQVLVAVLVLAPRTHLLAQTWNAADVMGPDGIIYPDWTYAGVPGGIPTQLASCGSVTSYGAVANDNLDDAAALEAAAEACFQAGGGVVSIPAGTFHLDRPVFIKRSNVVLRGASRSSTKFIFRFAPPAQTVAFYFPPGANTTTLAKNNWLEVHADPTNLQRLTLKANGVVVSEKLASNTDTWGATFSVSATGKTLGDKAGYGSGRQLVAEAEYPNGVVLTQSLTVTLNNAYDANAMPRPKFLAAINFVGAGQTGSTFLLTQDALRGQNTVTIATGHTLAVGDMVEIFAPATPRWNTEVDNACTGIQDFRRYQARVTGVNGGTITLNQPLRIDFPTVDGSYLLEFTALTGNGVESLSLEQTNNVWTSGIVFSWAWGSWTKDVEVKKAGRFPLYFSPAKFCEVRDSVFNDAWFKGAGGTAYVGFDYAYDCLMDGVTTTGMRHAPLLQWSAAGNVVRRGTFLESDAQWHAGWTNENLFEQITNEFNRYGNYVNGMWSSPPEDTNHGPNGPRNVVYNSDVTSPEVGISLGGMNRGWIFAHNRIQADLGAGLSARKNSGDHVITGNVFALKKANEGVRLESSDCTGVKLTGNDFYGVSSQDVASGAVAPAVAQGNTTVDALTPFLLTNPGFESGWAGWTQGTDDNGMSQPSPDASHQGLQGLRVIDANTSKGSSVYSATFSVEASKVYGFRYWQRVVSGSGMGIYFLFYDSTGTELLPRLNPSNVAAGADWQRIFLRQTAPPGAATAKIWLHSYGANVITADFDDFEFGELPHELANAGFESDLTHWGTTGDNGMSQASASAKYGSQGNLGLRVTDTSSTLRSSLSSREFIAQAGWTYQVRFWAREVSGSGISVHLQFLDSAHQELLLGTQTLPDVAEWSQYSHRLVAPANTAFVRLWIRSNEGAVVTADFDNFVLSEVPPRPQPVVPSIFEWQRNPVFPMTNPGFESGLTGWDVTNDQGMSSVVAAAAHTGAQGLRVTSVAGSGGSSALSAPFFVQPGKSYRTRFWSRLASGTTGMGVYLKFYNAQGTEVGSTNRTVSVTAWTSLQLDATAPSNAVTARIWLHSYNANTVTADLDDFEFLRL
ncbi:carbohydrate binding domain-containing protein [Hyalangium versicolor]|uniref:carbohydrate binding domain-containing protein n=1 Tax=Hyalangium versicolor TaxID=2861190 RepID=UPI001CC9E2F4|nr:carbohydrate binding domain-containing protein [Hyalangium versicolor]